MNTIAIPKQITKGEELVVIPRSEYERFLLLASRREEVSVADVLRWSREARRLKRTGKLSVLHSLKDFR